MVARRLMIQGTGSDVGKSLIVAGLCRAYARRGLAVLPFKPQNMSNNAAVTVDGGEIGRAQALQARAARVPPTVHMNPVLLKPQSEVGSQIVVQGRALGSANAREFQSWKPRLMEKVVESFETLAQHADLVLVEGAGSASELNLRANDIANMGFARRVDCPVILVGDVDRGGVIAQIVGTKAVLDPQDADLVQGFVVNRFRGDPTLFDDAMRAIEDRSGWPALGLVPFFPDARLLPAEDALALERAAKKWPPVFRGKREGRLKIVALVLPHIANFDDLDPLAAEPDVQLIMLRPGAALPGDVDLVILPGSKASIADLRHLVAAGWDVDIKAHVRRGGRVLGICGGYQMLGKKIADPQGIEGPPAEMAGLGLLDVETILAGPKQLFSVIGKSADADVPVSGYRMHMGHTDGPDCARRLHVFDDGESEGATSPDGLIAGTYVHGLFSNDAQRRFWIERLGGRGSDLAYEQVIERVLDGFADHLERHLDLTRLLSLAR